ncbi:MAG: transcription antitermination factor NusB [Oligoflexia bacterium]|nr:transcription antitermination factor NusB [Oligoflexia bacterium]
MKSRHKAREVALQILYRFDVKAQSTGQPAPAGAELVRELQGHFEHFQTPQGIREYASQLVAGTLQNGPAIDGLLETHAANWKLARMAFIDRALLRMAAYELTLIKPEVPASVVIDEAIELAKEFGSAETPAFVNGILDALRKAPRTAQD